MVLSLLKMAESVRDKIIGNSVSRPPNENSGNIECAVCLQPSVHPAELPCGHIFCYLCIKGIVNQGRRCAMCRQDIPVDYLDKPRLLKPVDLESVNQGFEDGHLWFYEGHNGWWQYDERTSLELEAAYQKGERCCELLIAGFLYIADFDSMLQYRRNDPSRRRRIKRDLATTSKKGVAGLKPTKDTHTNISAPELVSNELIQSLPISGQSILDTIDGMRMLSLSEGTSGTSSQQNARSEQRTRSRSSSTPNVTCNTNSSTLSNTNTQSENDDTFYSRNFDLDSIIHDTLDWTIEQIESLNLELLNDYEILFRGVNSYDRLHESVDRNRAGRSTNSYQNSLPNSRPRINGSGENELDSRVPNLPVSRIQPPESSESQDVAPQPPPRTRSSRIRSRVMFPRRSTSLSRETLF